MARKTRYMDTSKGYSRAAHKAVTMAVVDEDYYEELFESDSSRDGGDALFRVSEQERRDGAAAVTAEPARTDSPAEPVQGAQAEPRPQEDRAGAEPGANGRESKKGGFLNRLFATLRGLG